MRPLLSLLLTALLLTGCSTVPSQPLKVLLVTGQSNKYHDWSKSSPLVKQYLEQTGRFTVEVATTPAMGQDMSGFRPDFSKY